MHSRPAQPERSAGSAEPRLARLRLGRRGHSRRFGRRSGGGGNDRGAALALDASSLAFQLAQVIESRAANTAVLNNLDLLDAARVQGKHALDTHAVGDLAHGEGSQRRAVTPVDDHALENLDALFVAFLDERVHPDAVAWTEIRDAIPAERIFDFSDQGVGAHGSALR